MKSAVKYVACLVLFFCSVIEFIVADPAGSPPHDNAECRFA